MSVKRVSQTMSVKRVSQTMSVKRVSQVLVSPWCRVTVDMSLVTYLLLYVQLCSALSQNQHCLQIEGNARCSSGGINHDIYSECKGGSTFNRQCCQHEQLPGGCQCFDISSESNYTNSMYHTPACPEQLDVIFYFYNRSWTNRAFVIRDEDNIESMPFDGRRRTFVVTHGFGGTGLDHWMLRAKDELLKLEDMNVVLVDWKRGARGLNYYQAVANTRTVGALTGRLLEDLHALSGARFEIFKSGIPDIPGLVCLSSSTLFTPQDMHLAGHSLGAHIMGYVGQEIFRLTGQKVGRITGLDPAGMAFESFSPNVRLDADDAVFVNVIHTNALSLFSLGFGIRDSIGHVDFYPNGGQQQPGCTKKLWKIIFKPRNEALLCSHLRAIDYFVNSIQDCRYSSPTLDGANCTMGYHTDTACRGDFYPTTKHARPFC